MKDLTMIDLSMCFVRKGIRIAFCEDAEFYDEQPTKIRQALRQRLRWAKGYLQNFVKHFRALLGKSFIFKNGYSRCASSYDMALQLVPLALITMVLKYAYRFLLILGIVIGFVDNTILALLISWVIEFVTSWLGAMAYAVLVYIREHKHIKTTFWRGAWFAFMFPILDRIWKWSLLFACFKKVEWKPIEHKVGIGIEDLTIEEKSKE